MFHSILIMIKFINTLIFRFLITINTVKLLYQVLYITTVITDNYIKAIHFPYD